MSKKTDLNNIDTKFDPKRVSKAGPENDLLLDYESERVVAGRGGLENTVGYNLPPKQNEIRYGKKVDPQRRVHRYHGPGCPRRSRLRPRCTRSIPTRSSPIRTTPRRISTAFTLRSKRGCICLRTATSRSRTSSMR